MNKFSKYKDCKYLICHKTFETEVNCSPIMSNFKYTFEEGVKYKCDYVEFDIATYYIIFISLNISFDGNNENDVKLIKENFHTISEHRKSIINELL